MPSKLKRKFLIFLCLIKSSTCLKSENEIKFANVSHNFNLFGKNVILLTCLVFTHIVDYDMSVYYKHFLTERDHT